MTGTSNIPERQHNVAAAFLLNIEKVVGMNGLTEREADMALGIMIATLLNERRGWAIIQAATTLKLPPSRPAMTHGDPRSIEHMFADNTEALRDLTMDMSRTQARHRMTDADLAFALAMLVASAPESDRELCLKYIDDPRVMSIALTLKSAR